MIKLAISTALSLVLSANVTSAVETREVRGRVVNEHGNPVAGADVSYTWRANGPLPDTHGKPRNLSTVEAQKIFWEPIGKMAPLGDKPAKTDRDGRFVLPVHPRFFFLMAMDPPRKHGGLVFLPKGDAPADVEIRLGPLVRVKGSLEGPGAGKRPHWTNVYTLVPEDPARPLATTRLVGCGSFESKFEMLLPPGRYFLNAYTFKSDGADDKTDEISEIVPNVEIVLTATSPDVDLGALKLPPFKLTTGGKKNRAKSAGEWYDYTKHYGEQAPQWHAIDARGVSKDAKISDFKGKWVLLDFWGLTCAPCIDKGLPKLMKFYGEHRAERDRFEIVSICIDTDEELKSLADLDKKVQPIVEHVWHQPLPFPVLLDPTFTTWERYGLPGLGTVVLIDPQGRLVPGDERTLAEKLGGATRTDPKP